MKSNYTSIKFKQWLDKLQQESWQLELLISGFSILGLTSSMDPLQNKMNEALAEGSPYTIVYSFVISCCFILTLNLVIHVILRGLWIGTIGLRYVSNDINYDNLNYTKKFTHYLKKKVGTFDKYISNLEDLCSILFAMTFLVLFYFISLFIFSLIIIIITTTSFDKLGILSPSSEKFIAIIFFILFSISSIIIFIDFITQGFLKKKKWTTFFYFPLYKVFSYITLSFLYRPLLYNFLDNKFGKRILFLLLPLYFSISILSKIQNIPSNYIIKNSYTSANFSNDSNYLNLIKENEYVKDIAIDSKIITNSYAKVFILFKEETEDLIFKKNKNLVPKKDTRGITNTFFKSERNRNKLQQIDSIYTPYLKTFNQIYQLKIDSTKFTSDFIITKLNKQVGFETVLSLKNISEGKHILKVSRINFIKEKKEETKEKEIIEKVIEIPFWYYKD